jgi:hypothetical protein
VCTSIASERARESVVNKLSLSLQELPLGAPLSRTIVLFTNPGVPCTVKI